MSEFALKAPECTPRVNPFWCRFFLINTPLLQTVSRFRGLSQKTEGRVSLSFVQANTSCSQESTHSHECAPFLSDQFAICACMCCVFSPPARAHHAVSYASLLPPPLPAFPTTIPPPPHCTGLLQGCACALRGEDTFYPFNLILLSCDAWIQGL